MPDSSPVLPDAWSWPCAWRTRLGRFLQEPCPLDLGAAGGASTRSAGGHQGHGLDLAALYQGRSELVQMTAAVLHARADAGWIAAPVVQYTIGEQIQASPSVSLIDGFKPCHPSVRTYVRVGFNKIMPYYTTAVHAMYLSLVDGIIQQFSLVMIT